MSDQVPELTQDEAAEAALVVPDTGPDFVPGLQQDMP